MDGTNNEALYADLNDRLYLIVREGDAFDVNSDPTIEEWRTIASVIDSDGFGLGGSTLIAGGTNFADAGDLVISLEFTDGSEGVFLVNVNSIAVPEPRLAILGFLAITIACVLRRPTKGACPAL